MAPRHHGLIVLGSGPAGCTAALYNAARANLAPLLLKGLEPGGQLTTTTDVDNWPADDAGVQGPELMERFIRHATRFGGEAQADHIAAVELGERPFRLRGGQGEYSCDALVVATGAAAKYLGLDSEEEYKGRGVSACATCDGFFFRDREVVVVGGGNTAVEEALYLADICSKVTLVHRRAGFRAEAIMMDRLRQAEEAGKVAVKTPFVLEEVLGDGKLATGARLRNVESDEVEDLAVAGVFIAIRARAEHLAVRRAARHGPGLRSDRHQRPGDLDLGPGGVRGRRRPGQHLTARRSPARPAAAWRRWTRRAGCGSRAMPEKDNYEESFAEMFEKEGKHSFPSGAITSKNRDTTCGTCRGRC